MKAIPFVLASTLTLVSSAWAQNVQVTLNGSPVEFYGVNPMMVNNRLMVPVRGIFEKMGANVVWAGSTRTVVATQGSRVVMMRVGDRQATVDAKTVFLDAPPVLVRDRVLVPLRFISESLGATVDWNAKSNAIAIVPISAPLIDNSRPAGPSNLVMLEPGTVIPIRLDGQLSSDVSKVGDTFVGRIETNGAPDYDGLLLGTVIQGHVMIVRPKTLNTPGVLGLAFDRIMYPNGRTRELSAALIGMDDPFIVEKKGVLIHGGSPNVNLKYVGVGAGAGSVISVRTEGSLDEDLIVTSVGNQLGHDKLKPALYHDVALRHGEQIGIRLNGELNVKE